MAMSGRADLHTHTTASDGLHRPADNVARAKANGLAAVAITDHDTVDGIAEALEAGERLGVTVVPGVEISTVAEGIDVHVLGYYMDWNDAGWRTKLSRLLTFREQRNELIIGKLAELGLSVAWDEVEAEAKAHGKDGGSMGRPHIAAVLVKKGYVGTMQEAFDRYLGQDGAAYANPPRLHPFEALAWIREAGGTSVIAHPGLYHNDALVEAIIAQGAQGIEVFHPDHDAAAETRYLAMAKRHGLIATGGSDFHGERQGVVFHGEIGSRTVDVSVLERLNPAGRRNG
ncbi:PHP domain-containing protein [Paenibacillus sp. MWE-103]|uniref:PHP domain-containing protein n=1 Tax=Paenibacillus artemisiicola TaxID=1172618 RepID=A0ABS3W9M4_9BACL|nr:PHP domain-containing protein [Paenibacillus artemisiicola]MBO7745007.1 PHP domain-containing protein [Paenibacillus artemisiicola]